MDVLRLYHGLSRVTVSMFNFRCQTFISVCNQPPRPTQPSISMDSVNEDQLWLGKAKAGMVHSVSGWTRVCK